MNIIFKRKQRYDGTTLYRLYIDDKLVAYTTSDEEGWKMQVAIAVLRARRDYAARTEGRIEP